MQMVEIGPFPEVLHYYMEQECEACEAKNYVVLKPGVSLGRCWNCGYLEDLPKHIDLPKPEHPLVMN